ncbi:hypothetical protein [Oscillatoria sp. FACHB-1407]|nr:hypothetical protein [Oscillatoria sp. FACHB-1407]
MVNGQWSMVNGQSSLVGASSDWRLNPANEFTAIGAKSADAD